MKKTLTLVAAAALNGCGLHVSYETDDVWTLWREPIFPGWTHVHLATFDSQQFSQQPNHNREACEQVAALGNSGPIIVSFIEDSPGNGFLYLSHLTAINALNAGKDWNMRFYCRSGRP